MGELDNPGSDRPAADMPDSYLSLIRHAIKAVPEVKWALGVVGVVSAAGLIIGGLNIHPLVAVFGFVVMILFMTALLVFAHAVRDFAQTGNLHVRILIWFAFVLFMACSTALFASATANIPWHLRDWIDGQLNGSTPNPVYSHQFVLHQPAFNVSVKDRYYYGVSQLGEDRAAAGKRISISRVRVEFDAHNRGQSVCCDVWVYVGSHPFPFDTTGGQMQSPNVPSFIADNEGLTEVKLKAVLVSAFPISPDSSQLFELDYDFNKGSGTGFPPLTKTKDAFSNPISVGDSLYVQVLIWEGVQGIDFDIRDIRVDLAGSILPPR